MAFLLKCACQKTWHRFFLIGLLSLPVILLLPILCNHMACAADVTLEWDPNPEPDIAGYELYYGLGSRNYSEMINVGNYTSCTIGGLELGMTYYLALKAYNTSGYRSDYSDEIRFTLGEPAEEPPQTNDDNPELGHLYGGNPNGPFGIFGGCFIETAIKGSGADAKAVLTKCSSMLKLILCGLAYECSTTL